MNGDDNGRVVESVHYRDFPHYKIKGTLEHHEPGSSNQIDDKLQQEPRDYTCRSERCMSNPSTASESSSASYDSMDMVVLELSDAFLDVSNLVSPGTSSRINSTNKNNTSNDNLLQTIIAVEPIDSDAATALSSLNNTPSNTISRLYPDVLTLENLPELSVDEIFATKVRGNTRVDTINELPQSQNFHESKRDSQQQQQSTSGQQRRAGLVNIQTQRRSGMFEHDSHSTAMSYSASTFDQPSVSSIGVMNLEDDDNDIGNDNDNCDPTLNGSRRELLQRHIAFSREKSMSAIHHAISVQKINNNDDVQSMEQKSSSQQSPLQHQEMSSILIPTSTHSRNSTSNHSRKSASNHSRNSTGTSHHSGHERKPIATSSIADHTNRNALYNIQPTPSPSAIPSLNGQTSIHNDTNSYQIGGNSVNISPMSRYNEVPHNVNRMTFMSPRQEQNLSNQYRSQRSTQIERLQRQPQQFPNRYQSERILRATPAIVDNQYDNFRRSSYVPTDQNSYPTSVSISSSSSTSQPQNQPCYPNSYYHRHPPPPPQQQQSFRQRPSLLFRQQSLSSIRQESVSTMSVSTRNQDLAVPLTIEISPGLYATLRGADETQSAAQDGFLIHPNCIVCNSRISCIADADFVLCPRCKVISPSGTTKTNGVGGVGLGFCSNR
jgi:hypothetical protein